MKQTNNAIKFLMAQYRAIFQKAYIKGVLSATVLTAGLSVGVANAVEYKTLQELQVSGASSTDKPLDVTLQQGGDTLNITQRGTINDTNDGSTKNKTATINVGLTVKDNNNNTSDGHIFNNMSGTDTKAIYAIFNGGLTIENTGKLTFGDTTEPTSNFTAETSDAAINLQFQQVNVNSGGELIIKAQVAKDNSGQSAQANSTTIKGNSVNISGHVELYNQHGSNAFLIGEVGADKTKAPEIKVSGSGAVITLDAGTDNNDNTAKDQYTSRSVLGWRTQFDKNNANNISRMGDAISFTDRATLIMNSGKRTGHNANSYAYGAAVWGSSLSFTNSTLEATREGGRIETKTTVFDKSTIDIKDETANLVFMPRCGAVYSEGGYDTEGSTKKMVSGTIDIKDSTVINQGSIFLVNGGTLAIDDKSKITAGATNGRIVVGFVDQSSKRYSFEGTTNPTLKISYKQLDSYLNKDNETIGTGITDKKGMIQLEAGGRLHFTDDTQVDLSNFKFGTYSGDASTYNDPTFVAGSIIVSTVTENVTTEGKVGSGDKAEDKLDGDMRIVAKNLAVSKDLGTNAELITLQADEKLTLGNSSGDFSNGMSFKNAYAKNIEFQSQANNDFNLKQEITLRSITQDGNKVDVADDGSIIGNVVIGTSGKLIVDGGNYSTNHNISIASGDLTITNNDKIDSSKLDVNGSFIIDGTQNNNILVSGDDTATAKTNAVLDLSDANIGFINTGNAGNSTKTSFTVAKNSQILFGDNLNTLLTDTKSNAAFFINGGTLSANDNVTVDAAKFKSGSSSADGEIVFDTTSGGTLDLGTNKLTLTATEAATETAVDIGTNSVVKAGTLALNSTKADGSAQEVRLETGTYTLQSGLASDTKSLVNVSGAKVEFGTYDKDTKTVSTSGGSITTNLKISNNGTVNVNAGDWTAKDITIDSGALVIGLTAAEDQNGKDFVTKFSGDSLQMTDANSNLTVNKTGIADFGKFTSHGTVDVFGTLNINGNASADTNGNYGVNLTSGQITVKSNAYLKFGTNATNDIAKVTSGTASVVIGNKINLDNNSTIRLDYASGTSITDEGIKKLKEDLLSASSFMDSTKGTIKGFINLGGATLDIDKHLGTEGTNGAPSLSWEKYESFADIDRNQGVTNDKLSQAVITGITDNANIKGSVGSLRQDKGVSSGINIAGNTALNNSASNNGHFATNSDGKDANLSVTNGSNLTLANGGIAGDISLTSTDQQTSTLYTSGTGETNIKSVTGETANFEVGNKTVVQGETKVKDLDVSAALSTEKAVVKGDFVSAENSLTSVNTSLDVTGVFKNSGVVSAETINVSGDFNANANVTAKTLEFKGNNSQNITVANNALVDVTNLVSKQDQVIQIGTYSKTAEENNGVAVDSSTGYLEVDVAKLNGATLYADPDYGDKTTLVAINKFDPKLKANLNTDAVGVIDGHIVVGKNSAVGLGVDTATLQKVIAKYQNGSGSLNIDDVGSVLYIAENVVVADGKQIVVNGNETAKDLASTKKALDYTNNGTTAQADMGLSKNAAVLIDMNAFTTGKDNKTQTTAVKFDKTNASINAESGARIFLVGDYDATSKLNLFEDNDTDAAQKGVDLKGSNIEIRSENGLLYTVLEAGKSVGYDVQLKIDDSKVDNALADASNPLKQTIIDYHEYNTAAPETTPPEGSKATTEKQKYFNDFLNIALNKAGGASAAETANRLGVYAGGAQTALYTSNTTSEAIAGRMGIGAQAGTMNIADNNQGTALWLTPIYKNNESDGFSAEGHNYGVDIDMYGLALGADFTLNNGLRVGAMFNVGSGDADGKQVAQGVSNDFDYYGFGAYVGFTVNNFSVVGDLSYTVADNDVIANTAHGKVGTNFDSSAISLGATAQYAFTFNGVDVTPHAGLRFTSVDMDDYTVESELYNDVAKINSDRMNVFSMPIGVTISKDMVAGSWVIKPSFDLTLTGNFGDDTTDGTTTWIGAEPFKTVNKTEVLDSFTYGATVGIAAKNGNFSIGLGANYTGSSNTDEYGINANLRFVF